MKSTRLQVLSVSVFKRKLSSVLLEATDVGKEVAAPHEVRDQQRQWQAAAR